MSKIKPFFETLLDEYTYTNVGTAVADNKQHFMLLRLKLFSDVKGISFPTTFLRFCFPVVPDATNL